MLPPMGRLGVQVGVETWAKKRETPGPCYHPDSRASRVQISSDQGHTPLPLTVILPVPNPSWCYGAHCQQDTDSQVHTQPSSQEPFPRPPLLPSGLTSYPVSYSSYLHETLPHNHQLCIKQQG